MPLERTRSTLASRLRGPWAQTVRIAARVPRPLLLALPFCLIPLVWTSPRLLIETADYNNPLDAGRWISHILAGWNPDNLGSPMFRDAPLLFPYLAFWRLGEVLSLPIEAVQRFWLCGLFAMAMISAWSLICLITPSASDTAWRGAVVILAFVFNPFTLTYWSIGHQVGFLAYAVAPLWLSTLIRTVRRPPTLTSGIRLGLVSLLFASAFNNTAIVVTMILLPSLLVCGFLLATRDVSIRHLLASSLSIIVWFALFNAWWLYPFARAAVSGVGYSYAGSAVNVLDYTGVASRVNFWEFFRGTGYWGFHTGYRGVPYYAWAHMLGDPIVVGATLWLAVCVFLPLIARRKSLIWTAFPIVLFAIGVFLAKGTNPPLGWVNRALYLEVPGFFLFRGADEKFAGLPFLALLIALAWMFRSLATSVRTQSLLCGVTGIAVVFSALPLFVGTVIQERTPSGVAAAISVPRYYEELAEWSEGHRGSLLVVPQTPTGYVKTTWGFAGADIIQQYSSIPVVTGSPDASPADGPTFASFLRAAREFDSPLLLRRYGITDVLVRRDIDSGYYPGTLTPATVEARLHAAGFPLVKAIGEFRLFQVPVAVSPVWAASAALAPTDWSAASQRLLVSGTALPVVRQTPGPAVRQGCVPDLRDPTRSPGSPQAFCGIDDGPFDIRVLSQTVVTEVRRQGDTAVIRFSSPTGGRVGLESDMTDGYRRFEIPLGEGIHAIRIDDLVLPLDRARHVSGEVTVHPGTQIQLLRRAQVDLVADGSFESEARANKGEESGLVATRDATDGDYSLAAVAQRDSVHIFRSVGSFPSTSTFEISFDYKHLEGDPPAFGLWQSGIEGYAIEDSGLKVGPGWHHYRTLITTDSNATSLGVFLYSFAPRDGVTINRYDDLVVRELPVARASVITSVDANVDANVSYPSNASPGGHSLIADGSFEGTLWNGASVIGGDASARAQATPSSDAVTGRRSLELTAVDGGASVSRGVSPFRGDSLYKISFAYRHVEGSAPAFGVWGWGLDDYVAKDFSLSTEPGWHRFETVVSPGPEASGISIFLYSFAGDRGRSVNRYDDVRVTAAPIPQRLLVLAGEPPPPDPVTKVEWQSGDDYAGVVRGISGEAWMVLPQTFDGRWHLQIESTDGSTARVLTHVRVDGYANGWLIQGDGDVRFSIKYDGSSDVARGFTLTLFGLGLLVAATWRRLKPRVTDVRGVPEVTL